MMDMTDLKNLLEEHCPADKCDEAIEFLDNLGKREREEITQLKNMVDVANRQIVQINSDWTRIAAEKEARISQEKLDLVLGLVQTVFKDPLPASSTQYGHMYGSFPVWDPTYKNFSQQPFSASMDSSITPQH